MKCIVQVRIIVIFYVLKCFPDIINNIYKYVIPFDVGTRRRSYVVRQGLAGGSAVSAQ